MAPSVEGEVSALKHHLLVSVSNVTCQAIAGCIMSHGLARGKACIRVQTGTHVNQVQSNEVI